MSEHLPCVICGAEVQCLPHQTITNWRNSKTCGMAACIAERLRQGGSRMRQPATHLPCKICGAEVPRRPGERACNWQKRVRCAACRRHAAPAVKAEGQKRSHHAARPHIAIAALSPEDEEAAIAKFIAERGGAAAVRVPAVYLVPSPQGALTEAEARARIKRIKVNEPVAWRTIRENQWQARKRLVEAAE